MRTLRVFSALVVLAIIAVAAVPLLVLVDLLGDGGGFGICPNGLTSCRTSYFHGPELGVALIVAIFVLVFLLRLSFQIQRLLERRRARRVNELAAPPQKKLTRRQMRKRSGRTA